MKTIKNIVWSVLIIMILAIIGVSIYNNENVNTIMHNFLNYLNLLVAPLGIVLGILYGYPLLKQKITESHITKQFEIIQDTNRIIRFECLKFKQKINPIFTKPDELLTKEYLDNISNDIDHLNELSIDASSDIHTYVYLLSNTILALKKIIEKNSIKEEFYFTRQFNNYLHLHIAHIQSLASLIRAIPSNANIKKMHIVTSELIPYVDHNTYYTIEGIEHSLNKSVASSSLVSFIDNTIALSPNCSYFYACHCVMNMTAPIVRCMYDRQIYAPVILMPTITNTKDWLAEIVAKKMQVCLIGYECYEEMTSKQVSYHLYYTTPSVGGLIDDENYIKTAKDIYIDSPAFSQVEIQNSKSKGKNILMVEILEIDLKTLFIQNKIMIEEQMLSELEP